jgi:HTH-type transcriptional regulator, transcriptional repressor of NAD biosynthesis genes
MQKKFKTGVVIGKFYPPHRGHHYLIDTALTRCEKVFVLVCHKSDQDIPGQIRADTLKEAHPAADLRLIDDNLPPEDSAAWAQNTLRALGFAPEAAFTSEPYGDAYAAAMNATHVCVDKARANIPCSGTQIRSAPLDNLQFLHPRMRAYFVNRVVIVGAESTGTTTMADALADHYGINEVPEYSREYCALKWRDGITGEWTSDEFAHIAAEQCRREDEAARTTDQLLICDTDAFATGLWHQRYMKTRSAAVEAIVANHKRADLYLLTGDEIPFVQDGLRDGEDIRHWMHELFISELKATGRKWDILTGTHQARFEKATGLIDQILAQQ